MQLEEYVQALSNLKYGDEPSAKLIEQMKKDGVIFATGYSDDNIEFYGAYSDEISYYDNAQIVLNKNNEFEIYDWHEPCLCYDNIYIDIDFRNYVDIKPSFPHKVVDIYDEDGELYCKAVVFSKKEIDKRVALYKLENVKKQINEVTKLLEENL